MIETNICQSEITDELLNSMSVDERDAFMEYITSIPFIHNLISKDRKYARDLPKNEEGRIEVDLCNPHILENMDYFRPAALHFKKYGCYTNLRPNSNPNSEYGVWARTEVERIWYGMTRPEDGEWIPGTLYFYWNYCPILQSKIKKGSRKAERIIDFPEPWDSTYLWHHYMYQAIHGGKYNDYTGGQHWGVIARRGCGKSLNVASMLARLFILGDNRDVRESVKGTVIASDKNFLIKDGTLNKFVDFIDHCAEHTQWPTRRIKSTLDEMHWIMGYRDSENDQIIRGTKNEITGISVKDNPGRVRGKRALLTIFEEFGMFPRFLETYNTSLYNAAEGDYAFGSIGVIGTGGEKSNNFSGALEMIYNPKGYNMYPLPNVFDKQSQGRSTSLMFLGAYMNRKGYYDSAGNSDIIGALVEVIKEREYIKQNSSDPTTVTQKKAEMPITIQECIMQTASNIYPVSDINERINEINLDPTIMNGVKAGKFGMVGGEVIFELTSDEPIHKFPHKDNKITGAVEMFMEPEKDSNGKILQDRYIAGADVYDNDVADSLSLGSIFVLDTFTDQIVCEYTGRPMFADDFYEICRRMCMYYNCKLNYEAHPYSQPVVLADGKVTTWSEVGIGTRLLAPSGKITKVIDIPVDEDMPIYKISLRDGRIVYASDNHIWSVYTQKDRSTPVLKTTKQMLETGVKNKFNQSLYFIPNGGCVNYQKKEIPVDSYTIGLLLAEGCFVPHHCHKNTIQLSASSEDLSFYKKNIPYEIVSHNYDKFNHTVYIDNCKSIMSSMGLYGKKSYDKFIPNIYLYNDYNVRMELLKGLMDGDGCSNTDGARVFVTTSERLSVDFMTLCRSLGINCKCRYVKNRTKSKVYKHYRISLYTNETVFKLPRKIENCHKYKMYKRGSKASSYIEKTAIKSIEFSHYEKGKCVTVDSKDGLYLIGDYVVTHNCNKKGMFSYFSRLNSSYLLADKFEWLSDRDTYKGAVYGNVSKGTTSTVPIKNYGRKLIRDWLLKPCVKIEVQNGEEIEVTYPNLGNIRNIALLKELSMYNLDGNFDRHDALVMLMIYREDRLRLFGGDMRSNKNTHDKILDDKFFSLYDEKASKYVKDYMN